ncbi:hypothetical protein [Roseomonas sp. AR75]|uniref:hypothetical protein n=1 Tax=Roseomonas sp. AR75 TaxID=2562311 RepID=UPI0010C0EA61|nr:hypothetical protein [Roseomonas sp. AR75]
MKTACAMVAALATLLLAAPASAQEVPLPLRGAWFSGDCADPDAMLALTARSAALLEAEAPGRLFRFVETRPAGTYTLGIGNGPEAPRLMFRARPEGLETIEPEAKTRDDRLPGDAPVIAWRRCPTPPASVTALHGEGIAFLAALEQIEASCTGGAPGACAEAVLRQGDVSGDGKLSPAEIARLLRGAAWLAAVQDGGTQESVAGSVAAGALGGILAARLLVESLDYDGDGRLSAAELTQDRAGGFAAAPGNAAGRPAQLDGLADGVAVLRNLIDGLMDR